NAVEAGVRSIEHGNLIRETAARAIKAADAFLVPTMVTHEAIYREGKRYGHGDHQIEKIDQGRHEDAQGRRAPARGRGDDGSSGRPSSSSRPRSWSRWRSCSRPPRSTPSCSA